MTEQYGRSENNDSLCGREEDHGLCFDAPWVVKQKIRMYRPKEPDVSFDAPWVVKQKIRIFLAMRPDVCFDVPRVVKAKMPFSQKKSRVRWYTTTRNFSYIADCMRFDEISFV